MRSREEVGPPIPNHRNTTLHAMPHYKPSQFTETPNKQIMIAAE